MHYYSPPRQYTSMCRLAAKTISWCTKSMPITGSRKKKQEANTKTTPVKRGFIMTAARQGDIQMKFAKINGQANN